MRHLARAALLDRNVRAVGRAQIDRRQRRGDVERDVVLARQDGDAVGADLVRGVAVGGDPVGADDDEVDLALAASSAALMLSVMTVVSMPSRISSQAVSRAPCINGRVSSAKTATCLPFSTAPRMTPSAVP